MPHLYPVSWERFEKFLLFIGCVFVREKGDHRVYKKIGISRPIIVPRRSDLPVFIIKNNLRTLCMTAEEYIHILESL
jgi:predicted RNA binding protein YcfA (HicA-like mRNA interferase family)